jgi:hypothetical protein
MSIGEKLEGRTLVDIRQRNRAAADLQLRVWPEVPVSALKLLCMALLSPHEKPQCDVVVYRYTGQRLSKHWTDGRESE